MLPQGIQLSLLFARFSPCVGQGGAFSVLFSQPMACVSLGRASSGLSLSMYTRAAAACSRARTARLALSLCQSLGAIASFWARASASSCSLNAFRSPEERTEGLAGELECKSGLSIFGMGNAPVLRLGLLFRSSGCISEGVLKRTVSIYLYSSGHLS